MLFDFQIPLENLSEDKLVLEACPCLAVCLDNFSASVLITMIILIICAKKIWEIHLYGMNLCRKMVQVLCNRYFLRMLSVLRSAN